MNLSETRASIAFCYTTVSWNSSTCRTTWRLVEFAAASSKFDVEPIGSRPPELSG